MIKTILFTIGLISLVLGVVGIFLPLLPTTPFILLAAWCFLRSSEKAHRWMYQQKFLGPILIDWEQNRAISRQTKIIAVSMILISAIIILIKVHLLLVKVLVLALLAMVTMFILTRNEGKK